MFLLTVVLVVIGIVHAATRPASWWSRGWVRPAWVIAQLAVLPLAFSSVLFPVAIVVTAAYLVSVFAHNKRTRVEVEDVRPTL